MIIPIHPPYLIWGVKAFPRSLKIRDASDILVLTSDRNTESALFHSSSKPPLVVRGSSMAKATHRESGMNTTRAGSLAPREASSRLSIP